MFTYTGVACPEMKKVLHSSLFRTFDRSHCGLATVSSLLTPAHRTCAALLVTSAPMPTAFLNTGFTPAGRRHLIRCNSSSGVQACAIASTNHLPCVRSSLSTNAHRYRTQLCNDGVSCKRKICFFAHTLEELRVSSVKVLNPEMARMGETFELDPFASGTSESGRGGGPGFSTNISNGGGLGRPHGGGSAGANHGGGCNNNSAAAAQQAPGFSMADMQQLTQLHAKLQAASGMGTLGALQSQLQQQQRMGGGGAAGGADPAAMEQLMHQLAQQQPHQHMDLMHVMSQVCRKVWSLNSMLCMMWINSVEHAYPGLIAVSFQEQILVLVLRRCRSCRVCTKHVKCIADPRFAEKPTQVLANQQHHHQQATAAAVAAATVQAGHNPMAAHLQLLQNGGG